MARPAKSLQGRVRDRSFLARRHGGLLAGALVRRGDLREIQERWQQASSEIERKAWAREFEKAITGERDAPLLAAPSFEGMSVPDFFAECLVHVKGPAAGEPFILEPWQEEYLTEFDRVDELGCRIYSRGILGVPRGNGKSPLAAGRALYDLVTRPDAPDSFCAAAARDQARITLDYARMFAAVARWPICSRSDATRSATRRTGAR